MTRRWLAVALLLVGSFGLACGQESTEAATAEQLLSVFAERVEAAGRRGETVIRGRGDWLFFVPELAGLLAGEFWTQGESDPRPAILDFKAQLERAGIELLFVPVPAKATIYPAQVSEAIAAGEDPPRVDDNHRAFLAMLEAAGIPVLDLVPGFLEARSEGSDDLYCHQDTHWSGRACSLAARRIAERIADRPWLAEVPRRSLEKQEREIEITGDLWRQLQGSKPPRERLRVWVVGERTARGFEPIEPWRESPVLLLGDSHTLVFHAGAELHARGAGLADHLALELGFPVDLVGVRGSGATPSRVNLLRRGDNLAGKRLVVWCLSVREYTQGQGWRKVPVTR